VGIASVCVGRIIVGRDLRYTGIYAVYNPLDPRVERDRIGAKRSVSSKTMSEVTLK